MQQGRHSGHEAREAQAGAVLVVVSGGSCRITRAEWTRAGGQLGGMQLKQCCGRSNGLRRGSGSGSGSG